MPILRKKFWTFGLLALLIACTPAATQPPAVDSAPAVTVPASPAADTATQPPVLPEATLTPAPTTAVLVVATSRGPNLEATDPSTVNLASGQLQLVEFFRFT